MKIIVCIKQARIVAARSAFDSAPDRLAPGHLIHVLNPFDEVAVEEALRIRDGHGGGEVTAVTLGPPRAAEALRRCVAMGADQAVHVVDRSSEDRDPWAVSRALAAVVRRLEYDLILCGRIAVDDEMGQVGTFLAELLNLPVVTCVVKLDLDPGSRDARLQRSLDRGHREAVECRLPAVLTVDRGLNRPRYPTLAGRRRAERHEIRTVELGSQGGILPGEAEPPALEIVRITPPKIRPRKILAPDDTVSAAGRLQWILSGGLRRKNAGPVTGDPAGLVQGIVDFLRERNILPGPYRGGGSSSPE